MINLLIMELVEDSTFVLDIEYLPDEPKFKDLRDHLNKQKDKPEDEEKELIGRQMPTYKYS